MKDNCESQLMLLKQTLVRMLQFYLKSPNSTSYISFVEEFLKLSKKVQNIRFKLKVSWHEICVKICRIFKMLIILKESKKTLK